MRVLVCGGRDYSDRESVATCLSRVHEATPFTVLIHGAAQGADALAAEWAKHQGVVTLSYPANWRNLSHADAFIKRDRHGRAYDAQAGYRRNQLMLERGRPDLVIAFPGGPGTRDMIKRARAARIKVFRLPPRPRRCAADGEPQRRPSDRPSPLSRALHAVPSPNAADGVQKFSIQPVRVQYHRGQRMPSPNGLPTVYVGRPTPFGNPFKVGTSEAPERGDAVPLFEKYINGRPELIREVKAKLRGKNLACWCPCDGQPCHADVLLCIANS